MDDELQIQQKLFAKLNGKRGKHLSVFTDERDMANDALQKFTNPNIVNAVAFGPGRTLHDDEWYAVELTESQITEMIQPYTSNARYTAGVNTIKADDYAKVAALYKTDGTRLLITKVVPSMRVESKTFIGLNDHPEIRSYQKAIEFTGRVDAYYDGSNMLYFQKYSKISSLFSGIEVFYRNATVAEKDQFLAKPFFDIRGIDADAIGMRDSHKIATVLDDDRIQLDDVEFQKKVLEYAKEFTPDLVSAEDRLKITDKETLRGSLNLLTERYYKSELFGDKREAIDSTKLEA